MNCFSWLSAFLLLLATHSASADTFCVGGAGASGDGQVASALLQATILANSGVGSEVHVRQRATPYVVNIPAARFLDLKILGGYSSDPNDDCVTRTIDATNTAIKFSGGKFDTPSGVMIEGLTLSHASGFPVIFSFGASHPYKDGQFKIYSNILRAPVHIQTFDPTFKATALFINNIAETDGSGNWCSIDLRSQIAASSMTAYVINNTVVKNTGAGGFCLKSLDDTFFYNNIIWANVSGIVDESQNVPTHVNLFNNVLQSQNSIFSQSGAGTISTDPGFADSNSDDFRLLPGSPAINSGLDTLPNGIGVRTRDIENSPGHVGTLVDRGAYESNVDNISMTFTVNSTSDAMNPGPGKMSFRGAISSANATPGLQTIKFNLPSCGTLIALNTPLPDITDDLVIDGGSQFQSTSNTARDGFNANVCVVLFNASNAASAVHIPSGSNAKLSVSGIKFAGAFSDAAIWLEGGSKHSVTGNEFATGILGNNNNVRIAGSATQVQVGGDEAGARNLLSGALTSVAIYTNNNTVVGNLIGPGRNGQYDSASSNNTGVWLSGGMVGNLVRNNTISGNNLVGVRVDGQFNSIKDNLIGTTDGNQCNPAPCSPALGNGVAGVWLESTGSQDYVVSNEIAYNPVGVCVYGQGLSYVNNSIHDNALLGIDLVNSILLPCDGEVNVNNIDPAEPPSAANAGINYPVLLEAHGNLPNAAVRGQFSSRNGAYDVYLYANPSCGPSGYGQGSFQVGVGHVLINDGGVNSNGIVNFEIPVDGVLGLTITALVKDLSGNTSEFSKCITVAPNGDHIFYDGLESEPGA
jgi:hypothetical protein